MKYERYYDQNTTEREGRNGRIYVGVVGWRWAVIGNGGELLAADFETKREAKRWHERECSKQTEGETLKTTTNNADRCYMVGSRWSQISERATPTMMTRQEARRRCDELNECEDVRRYGNSPFFVTTRPSFAAE